MSTTEQREPEKLTNEETGSGEPVGGSPEATANLRDIEVESLREQAQSFIAQAEDLRVKARNNIRWIVATVTLMTVLVVILPPIIDILEDEILKLSGRETSKFDLQTETRNQAIEVQTSSTILSRMLDKRDQTVGSIRDELAKPYHFFQPELLEEQELVGEIVIRDVAQAGKLQVAVGGAYELDDSTPVVFYKTSGEETWRLSESYDPLLDGEFTKAIPYEDGVLVVGASPPFSAWLISPEGQSRQVLASIDLPDGAPRITQVSVSEGFIAFLLAPDGANTSFVVVTDMEGRGVFEQPYIAGEIAKDIIWSNQDLLVLTSGGFSEPDVVYRFSQFSSDDEITSNNMESSTLGQTGGIGFVREGSALDSVAVLALDLGFFDTYVQSERNRWVIREDRSFSIDWLEDTTGRDFLVKTSRGHFFGGAPNTVWWKDVVTSDATSIELDAKLNFESALEVDFLADGRLRLMSFMLRDTSSLATWSLYAEAIPPVLPDVQTSQEIVSLLKGVDAGNTSPEDVASGDSSASAEGVDGGETYLDDSIRDFADAIKPEWIVSKEALSQLRALEAMGVEWTTEWNKRERAASILARLRQADERGSLFDEVSSLVARLAVIALLIYLVNILVNLYRYNMRLAAFYQAQGNSIEMAIATGADLRTMTGASFASLAAAQTPETVSFGTRPAPPTETILKTVADMAKKVN